MSLIGSLLLTLFAFGFVISIVVTIHELGHYWAGRSCGVHAEAFSIGFGPTLLSWRDKNGTVWRVAAFPLGGYVRFLGDAGAASEPDAEKLAAMRARMGPDAEKCYHFKPVWQRSIITAAGPVANFILAAIIFASLALAVGGPRYNPPLIGATLPGSAAAEAGFLPGDQIVSINGKPIRSFQDISQEVIWRGEQALSIGIQRGNEIQMIEVAPQPTSIVDGFGGTRRIGQVGLSALQLPIVADLLPDSAAARAGFRAGDTILSVEGMPVVAWQQVEARLARSDGVALDYVLDRDGEEIELTAALPYHWVIVPRPGYGRSTMGTVGLIVLQESYGLLGAFVHGVERTWTTVSMTVRYVGNIITGQASTSLLNGPLGIAEAAGQTASASIDSGRTPLESATLLILNLIQLAGFLSVGLGLVNLLPIPILDGGHLVYYAYEAVARRPLSMQMQSLGFRFGLALVLGMMLLATWNDINYKLSQFF